MDFVTAYSDLMDSICRPVQEGTVLTKAKLEINLAMKWLQRALPFRFCEDMVEITYLAGTFSTDIFQTVGDAEIMFRDIQSVQLVTGDSPRMGPDLRIATYSQIQSARRRWQDKSFGTEWDALESLIGHSVYASNNHRYYAFRMGQKLGLYPTPTLDVNLFVHGHIWLPELSLDEDTNFLLEYGYDVVFMLALKKLCIYLKEDNRYSFTDEDFTKAYESLTRWDAEVQLNSNFPS